MKCYARFQDNGVVAEVHYGDPFADFYIDIAKQFVEVPEGTKALDKKLDDGTFEPYVEPPEPEPFVPAKMFSDAALKRFMTRAERIAYKAAAASDPIIEDFADMLGQGPVLTESADTVEAIDKLKELKVLTAARATELKALEG